MTDWVFISKIHSCSMTIYILSGISPVSVALSGVRRSVPYNGLTRTTIFELFFKFSPVYIIGTVEFLEVEPR